MRLIPLILTLLVCASSQAQQKTFTVHVKNPLDKARTDVPVVLNMRKVHFEVKTARVTLNGHEVPCQLDDMDGDFRHDELVFLADVGGHSENKYRVSISAKGKPRTYPSRVYAHMGLNDKYGKLPAIDGIEAPGDSYVFKDVYPHGAEFESELTAYRVYVDNRQNIDLYGKRQRRLELEKTHFYSVRQDLDEGYGNDVLWAGASMGCGTLREFSGGGPVLIDDVSVRGQRVVARGPLRTVVEMKDMGWKGNNVRTHYILYAGHREVEVQVRSDAPLSRLQLCTGVQKVGSQPTGWVRGSAGDRRDGQGKKKPKTERLGGLAASWGSDYPDYGKKDLYRPEAVGLGVWVPDAYFAGTAEDSLQYMCRLKMDRQNFLRYYVTFCADMEQQDGFHTAADWFAYLEAWRRDMLNAPKIKYFIRLNNKK